MRIIKSIIKYFEPLYGIDIESISISEARKLNHIANKRSMYLTCSALVISIIVIIVKLIQIKF